MKIISIAFVGFLLLSSVALGQDKSDRLAKLTKTLHEKIEKEKPGWVHRSVTPMDGSKNVIIEQWQSENVIIKVAVTEYDTQDDAVFALKKFKTQLKIEEQASTMNRKTEVRLIKDDLPGLGDEGFGFSWDIRGAESAAFRKGNLLVFVSIAQPFDRTDVWSSKEFAKYVADVIPTP